ncbi:MAG: branched-chain amino acid ABC transporter permease [Arenicellales bacterium]|jgi:branched-chain amino acid transport system permease protein|nr:branched-chain amino acid ABC transporter permease [Arenicellales bacterium]|tara:strand:- start:2527 stop:3396 length:870 start_codon:yes stop_codon:yes gene_type:complete
MGVTLANIVVTGCLYTLLAIGLTMVYGMLRVLHIAHAAVFAVGAMVGLFVFQAVPFGLWLAILLAMLASGLMGVAIYHVGYRWVLDAPRGTPLIVSIGIFIAVQALLERPFLLGPQASSFDASPDLPALALGGFGFTPIQTTIVLSTGAVGAGVWYLLSRTRLGLSWRALSEDINMARSLGVATQNAVALNMFLGSAMAGLAGVLIAVYENSVSAYMGEVVAYKAFVIVVLGGLGSVLGAAVAAFTLAAVEIGIATVFGGLFPRNAIGFAVLILILLFAPTGLFGKRLD